MAVMRVESAGDPTATSSAGAIGLMQVMPNTYATLRARLGLGANAYDPHDNIMAGAAYLRELHDRYGSVGFLAAYNAGPGRWEDHLAGVRPLPPETIRYMEQLAPMLGERAANTLTLATSPTMVTPETAPIFVTLGTGSTNLMSGLATFPRVQLAATEAAARPQADGLFAGRRLAAEPPSNADSRGGDTAPFPSRPRVSAADPTSPSLRSDLLFVARAPSREHLQ